MVKTKKEFIARVRIQHSSGYGETLQFKTTILSEDLYKAKDEAKEMFMTWLKGTDYWKRDYKIKNVYVEEAHHFDRR